MYEHILVDKDKISAEMVSNNHQILQSKVWFMKNETLSEIETVQHSWFLMNPYETLSK